MNVHFQNLIAFCDNYPPIQRAYRDFLYARPTMDPESFKLVTKRLCQLSETIIFLIKCLSYHMGLMVGRKTKNNRIFVEYLGAASSNLRKAQEFIDLAAEELRAYQDGQEECGSSTSSSKCCLMAAIHATHTMLRLISFHHPVIHSCISKHYLRMTMNVCARARLLYCPKDPSYPVGAMGTSIFRS